MLAILALVAGVALAPSRRRALVIGASMVVASLVLLLLGLQVLRALYLDDLEEVLLVPQVATVLFDTVTTPLRLAVRSTAMLFLVIALGAWLAGPSNAAAAVRSVPRRLSGMTRQPTGALGSVSRFAARYTVPLRAAVGGLAVLAVLVGDRPSAGGVLLIAVLAAVALMVIEVLRRWGSEPDAADDAGPDAVAWRARLAASAAQEEVGGGHDPGGADDGEPQAPGRLRPVDLLGRAVPEVEQCPGAQAGVEHGDRQHHLLPGPVTGRSTSVVRGSRVPPGSGAVAAHVEPLEAGVAEAEVGPPPGVVQHRHRAGREPLGHLPVALDAALAVAEQLGERRDAGRVPDDHEHVGVLVGLVDDLEEALRRGQVDAAVEVHLGLGAAARPHALGGLLGALRRGAEHLVDPDAVLDQPVPRSGGVAAAAPGELSLVVVVPALLLGLRVAKEDEGAVLGCAGHTPIMHPPVARCPADAGASLAPPGV